MKTTFFSGILAVFFTVNPIVFAAPQQTPPQKLPSPAVQAPAQPPSSSMMGKDASGAEQMTTVDEHGRLKVVEPWNGKGAGSVVPRTNAPSSVSPTAPTPAIKNSTPSNQAAPAK